MGDFSWCTAVREQPGGFKEGMRCLSASASGSRGFCWSFCVGMESLLEIDLYLKVFSKGWTVKQGFLKFSCQKLCGIHSW